MPDRRTHRGAHPEDARAFDAEAQLRLIAAAGDFRWLLNHGYPHDSSLKLVGDRYDLLARQRTAVSRCCCSDAEAARRRSCQVAAQQLAGAALWLDGYNVLTTIEAALAGGVILAACDGTYRDMASMHGSYRKVAETLPALELLGRAIAEYRVAQCRWFLDRPVSNSGRLKGIIENMAAERGWPWAVELVADPDTVLASPAAHATFEPPSPSSRPPIVVATADSAILDRCPAWFNLASEVVSQCIPAAWVIQLGQETAS
jgi:hypothetical protein